MVWCYIVRSHTWQHWLTHLLQPDTGEVGLILRFSLGSGSLRTFKMPPLTMTFNLSD